MAITKCRAVENTLGERERSALRDPLNRTGCHAELSGDLMKSWPPRSRQSVTDSLFRLC